MAASVSALKRHAGCDTRPHTTSFAEELSLKHLHLAVAHSVNAGSTTSTVQVQHIMACLDSTQAPSCIVRWL